MMKFNAEDAMNGAEVVTNSGCSARVVCIDAKCLHTGESNVVWALISSDE